MIYYLDWDRTSYVMLIIWRSVALSVGPLPLGRHVIIVFLYLYLKSQETYSSSNSEYEQTTRTNLTIVFDSYKKNVYEPETSDTEFKVSKFLCQWMKNQNWTLQVERVGWLVGSRQ